MIDHIKYLISKYLPECLEDALIFKAKTNAYIPISVNQYKKSVSSLLIIIDSETVIFKADNLWYRGVFVDSSNIPINKDIINNLLKTNKIQEYIQKHEIYGVSGFENYDTIEELFENF